MLAKKRVLGSDLKKVDRHIVQPHEYDEIPELTADWFASADHYRGGKLVQRSVRGTSITPVSASGASRERPAARVRGQFCAS